MGTSPPTVMNITAELAMLCAPPCSSVRHISSVRIRLHGLDALRGIAAILVVLLHAGIPYMSQPLPYLAWPARDVHPSGVVDGVTWCTECFLMPLFFVLAGFFSLGLLIARGERDFLAGRTNRLLKTQLLGGLVILPLCLGVWSLGWMADGLYLPKNFIDFRLPPELEADLFGVAHLWFLQNLYIYCLILCGISWLAKRFRSPEQSVTDCQRRPLQGLDAVLLSAWKPLFPAIPCALILYCDTRIVLGFYQSFLPVISKLAYYAVFFFMGVMICRNRDALPLHARFGKTYLIIASVLFMVMLPLIHDHLRLPLTGLRLISLATLLALFACFMAYGLFALFLRTRHGNNALIRYLAESSFWVYLIHLPFVVLTQIAIAQLPVPTVGKFLLAAATALSLALMTYHVFVRDTWLGEFLDGRRRILTLAPTGPEPAFSQYPIAVSGYSPEKRLSTVSPYSGSDKHTNGGLVS